MRPVDLGVRAEYEFEYRGFVIDYEVVDYEDFVGSEWDMERRWAFSNVKIFYDPEGRIKALIDEKVCLRDEEKRWLIIEGVTQSEWYCNVVSESWVYRNDMVSAHYCINIALDELIKALFMLNDRLLPVYKWRIYLVQRLGWLPEGFNEKLREVLLVKDFSIEELGRRRDAFWCKHFYVFGIGLRIIYKCGRCVCYILWVKNLLVGLLKLLLLFQI